MAGVNDDGKKDQTMILNDRVKYAKLTGSEMFRPTWDNMIDLSTRFVKDIKGTEPERIARIKAVMNSDYQDIYTSVFKKADDLGLDIWKPQHRKSVLSSVFKSEDTAIDQWNDRFAIHTTLGANEHFLGTGYTKSLLPGAKETDPGIAEIFVVENNLLTIDQLENAGAIKVFDVIEPLIKK
jgi:hypothetical protein